MLNVGELYAAIFEHHQRREDDAEVCYALRALTGAQRNLSAGQELTTVFWTNIGGTEYRRELKGTCAHMLVENPALMYGSRTIKAKASQGIEDGIRAALHYPGDLFALIVGEATDITVGTGERVIRNPRIIHRYKR